MVSPPSGGRPAEGSRPDSGDRMRLGEAWPSVVVLPIPLTRLHLDSSLRPSCDPGTAQLRRGSWWRASQARRTLRSSAPSPARSRGWGSPSRYLPSQRNPQGRSHLVSEHRLTSPCWPEEAKPTYVEERAEAWGVRWRHCKLVAGFWSPQLGHRLLPLVGGRVRDYFYHSSFCSAFLRFGLRPLPSVF